MLALRITDNRSWGEKSEKFSPGAPPPDPRFICAILILFKFAQALSGKSVECTVFGVRIFFFKCVRARVFLRFRSFLWKTYRKCIILYSKNHQTFRLPQNNIKPKRTKSPLRLNCRTSSASAWRGPHCSLVSYTILYYKIKLYYSVRYYTILLQ